MRTFLKLVAIVNLLVIVGFTMGTISGAINDPQLESIVQAGFFVGFLCFANVSVQIWRMPAARFDAFMRSGHLSVGLPALIVLVIGTFSAQQVPDMALLTDAATIVNTLALAILAYALHADLMNSVSSIETDSARPGHA